MIWYTHCCTEHLVNKWWHVIITSQVMFLVLLIHFNERHCINTDYRWATHHGLIIIFVYMTANAAFRLYSNNRNLRFHDKSV